MIYFFILSLFCVFCIGDGVISILKEKPIGLNVDMYTSESVRDFAVPYGACMIVLGVTATLCSMKFCGYIELSTVAAIICGGVALVMAAIIAVLYKKVLKKKEVKKKKTFYR